MFLTIIWIFGFVYLWHKWNYGFWNRKGVPTPSPTFLVGNIGPTLIQREHIGILADKWYRMFPNLPYVGFYKHLYPAILLRDIELVRDVMIKDFSSFSLNDVTTSDDPNEIFGGTPFTETDEQKWRAERAVLTPIFTKNKLKAMYSLMQHSTEKMINFIEHEGCNVDVDSKSLTSKYAVGNIVRCIFSVETDCFKDSKNEYRKMGRKLFHASFMSGFRISMSLFFPSIVKFFSMHLTSKDFDQWARKFMKANIKSRENTKTDYDDVLQVLLNFQKKMNTSEDRVITQAIAFYVDGYETSSTTLAFALWYLAQYPDIQNKLYKEVATIVEKHQNTLSYEAINEMVYLGMVLHETMRLNPVGLTMQRICTKPYALPKLRGQQEAVVLQPGTSVLIPVYSIHHDPQFYPDPYVFDPMRFTEEKRHKLPKCAHLPFGEGPRICVGRNFGMMQMKVALATIVKNFKIVQSPNSKSYTIDPRSPLLFQTINRLLIRFEKRQEKKNTTWGERG